MSLVRSAKPYKFAIYVKYRCLVIAKDNGESLIVGSSRKLLGFEAKWAGQMLGGKVAFKRWLYRGGHPNRVAQILNRGWAIFHSLGIFPNYLVTLEVVGRQSGKMISFPLAMTVINGERYLVSMLGEETNWVRNVKAARGKARLRHGVSEQVLLVEVEVSQRAPILKAYLQHAPGARPHIPISKDAPISEFEKITSKYPVFRLETMN